MPFNGSGVFSIINSFTPNTTIASSPMNANFTDIASGLSDCLTRDGQAPMTAALLGINGSVSVPSFTFAADPTNGLYRAGAGILGVSQNLDVQGIINQSGNPLVPAGAIIDFAGSAAPAGWLLCYGQAVSRTTYATLFAAISTTYGSGDGSTTFNLPDGRGRIFAGLDNMGGTPASRLTSIGGGTTLGAGGGEQTHLLSLGEMPAHQHTGTTSGQSNDHVHGTGVGATASISAGAGGLQVVQPGSNNTGGTSADHNHTFTTSIQGGSGAHNNVQPTMLLNKIIKF